MSDGQPTRAVLGDRRPRGGAPEFEGDEDLKNPADRSDVKGGEQPKEETEE
jgi:hypothetical protein